ncbi:hypothetical protein PIB30_084527 [Stylosanthes scabra]|uniref:Ubiquitin-like protease family profile domain-containing protein n=1 Tax=Stylosanthes scabra TaxID=79078 RepID=A0ABU6TS25_9FABA|nr:hypothetical protein [Stylosanthes scabra]
MSQEHPMHSEPDDAPSFDLGINYGTGQQQTQEERLLTTQAISEIEVVGIMCHILNMEQSERFQKQVYCVPAMILNARNSWSQLDGQEEKKPHDIGTLKNHEEYMGYLEKDKLLTHRFLFAPILFSEHWWLYVLDCNILDQMLRWAGASSMFKKGTHSLLPRYINIPGQPNKYDCGVYVMKWMKLIDPTILIDCSKGNKEYNIETWPEPKLEEFRKSIVAKIMLSKSNAWRVETIRKANRMRNTKPAPILLSPFVQVSSADLAGK